MELTKYLRQKFRKHHEEMFSELSAVIDQNFLFPRTHHLQHSDKKINRTKICYFSTTTAVSPELCHKKSRTSTDLLRSIPSCQYWTF